jgi:glycosyltransferase involved in cell wall biosynthesis
MSEQALDLGKALPSGPVRRWLRRTIGLWPILEWRNRLLLGSKIPAMKRYEDREVARLLTRLGGRPRANIAVIVPTFRRPDGVVGAVESILAQTRGDFVVIVVDDGGGLSTLPDDERVFGVSLSQNTTIAGLVRNVGIRLTLSPFIAFLDDDNTWLPEHLELTIGALEAGADLVYTDVSRRRPDGSLFDVLSGEWNRKVLADRLSFVDTSAVAIRRAPGRLFSQMPRSRETMPREDWEFVYRISRGMRVKHIANPTVNYLVNPASFYTPWLEEHYRAQS